MSAREMLAMGQVALDALDTIEKLTHIGGEKAEAALFAIRAILGVIKEGFDGKLTPQAVLSQLEALHHGIEQNDATAIAELLARFKTS